MKRIFTFLILFMSMISVNFTYSQTSNLIISEYGEGSSGSSKFIEIYNGTGSAVDLSNYQLWRISNGGNWPEATYNFSAASLADGATIVVANNSSDVPGADEYNAGFCSWNGDDAVGLAYNGGSGSAFNLIDAIGEDGSDPGDGWDVAGVTNATKDHRLTRKSSICDPNTDWTQSAGTNTSDSEWIVESYSTGSANAGHTASCSSSNDSDAEANDTGSQPAAATISSIDNDDSNNPVDVFNMDIYDWATSDGLPTHVTNVRIKPKNTNTADWTDNIQGVVVDDGTNYITPSSVDITDTYIDIHFTSGDLDVADNSTRRVNIAIYLNTSNIEDGKILSFMVDSDDHGFTADASGTQFKADFGSDFYSNDFTIGVEATEMQFQQQPTDVEVNTVMTPAVTVAYTDANGNVDVDYDGNGFGITMTTTGTFDGSATTSVDPVQGVATFDNLIFSATGTDETITADNGGWTTPQTKESDPFDITAACTNATANINEFHYDNVGDDTNEFVEIYIEDPQPSTLSDYTVELYNGNGGGSYDNETLDNFTATAGTGGTYYVWDLPQNGIQNGPDGIALGGPCGLMEFLSYEDTFQATDGIADGQTSTDVGVEETSSTPENSSIQLVGGSWVVTDGANTKGAENSSTQPLELLDLSVTKINNSTLISWTTSSELNNDYFSIEWSRDGRNFKEIAQVKSKGNHRGNQEYGFTHRNPALGTNYYRLTQYDLDGRSETFNIVSVTFDFDNQDMIIAPNKVNNNLIIEFSKPVENGSLLIYDMEGQMIKNSILAKGIDMINLDVSGLPSGQYIVKYLDVKGTATKKFVKI